MKALRTFIAAAALVVGLSAGAVPAGPESAEAAAPPPPARFVGRVTINGVPALGGQQVKAYVGTTLCGTGTTFTKLWLPNGASFPILETFYVVDVAAASPATPGCGYNGATVRFSAGQWPAAETGTWENWHLNQQNLTLMTRWSP